MKAQGITTVTMVAFYDQKYPVTKGNCFSVETSGGKEYRIVNFVWENLIEAIRRGVTWPIEIKELSPGVAVINDVRIPDDWYATSYCECCCPLRLLPEPQRLQCERHKARELNGPSASEIRYLNTGKEPSLPDPDEPESRDLSPDSAIQFKTYETQGPIKGSTKRIKECLGFYDPLDILDTTFGKEILNSPVDGMNINSHKPVYRRGATDPEDDVSTELTDQEKEEQKDKKEEEGHT